MNIDILKGNWNQLVGGAKEKWGDITENEWMETKGEFDKIVGLIQERYGKVREEVEKEVSEWMEKNK